MSGGEGIGRWAGQAALMLGFALVVVPAALLLRLVGHDPLKRRYEPGRTSYWEPPSALRERTGQKR